MDSVIVLQKKSTFIYYSYTTYNIKQRNVTLQCGISLFSLQMENFFSFTYKCNLLTGHLWKWGPLIFSRGRASVPLSKLFTRCLE